uniref:RNA-editing substrate-binding complex 6 protein domain-containing protein n=1 Tax=Alexandrium monilatum TaxID=311494 RepID=A0A7S4RMG5_9DINO
MWRALRRPGPRPAAAGAAAAPGRRGFANRKPRWRRLDEYDTYDQPLRMKVWKKVREKASFYEYSFEDMSAPEVAETLWLAVKLDVSSDAFWERAATAMGDIAPAMSAKQLATACWAFGAARWRDEAMVISIAPTLSRRISDMKHSDLAVLAQSFARSQVCHPPVLRAISRAAQGNQLLTCKGLAMITGAFASLKFRSEDFLRHLDAWAATGAASRCSEDQAVELAHARGLFGAAAGGDGELADALAVRVAESADFLEPPMLLTSAMAFSRLRVADPELLGALQKAVHDDLHRFVVKSLPALLDTFTDLYIACDRAAGVKTGTRESMGPERRRFITHLTGRLARELRHLRPQDACRTLQSLERLGILDPYLLSAVQETVPPRLAAWPPSKLLSLLEAYAAAENSDGFMVACLRQALLPRLARPPTDIASGAAAGIVFDWTLLAQLDDMAVARAAEAFAKLRHREGILALLAVLRGPPGGAEERRLAPPCELAVAATACAALSSEAAWAEAAGSLLPPEGAEGGEASAEALGHELRERWLPRAEVAESGAHGTPDTLLMALCAFQGHGQGEAWREALRPLLPACSPALLPGLLMLRPAGEQGPLEDAAEEALIQHLESGHASELPAAAATAALRALARRTEGHTPRQPGPLSAARRLVARIAELAEAGAVPCKALVRALQAVRALHVEPPPSLVRLFAEAGDELTSAELMVALRLLSARSVAASGAAPRLGALATRALSGMRSSRQAWELEALCKTLSLEVGDLEAVTVEDEPGHEKAEAPAGRAARAEVPGIEEAAAPEEGPPGEGSSRGRGGELLHEAPWLREQEIARPRPRGR